jgi:hypothetical protein
MVEESTCQTLFELSKRFKLKTDLFFPNSLDLPPKMQLPQRHGKKWYEGESHYILLRVKQGIPPSKIAKEVSRTTNGITAQLKRLGVQKSMSMVDLTKEVASLRSRIEVLERRNKPAGNGLNAIRAVRAGDEYLN